MNAATLATSPRLRRVFRVLKDGEEHTTREVIRRARVCAVNSCIAELRANGARIDCRQEVVGGVRRWLYRMVDGPESATEAGA